MDARHPLDFLTNPERFMAFSRWAAPLFGLIAVALAVWGLWLGFNAPDDYQQGQTVNTGFVRDAVPLPAALILPPAVCVASNETLPAAVAVRSPGFPPCPEMTAEPSFTTRLRPAESVMPARSASSFGVSPSNSVSSKALR